MPSAMTQTACRYFQLFYYALVALSLSADVFASSNTDWNHVEFGFFALEDQGSSTSYPFTVNNPKVNANAEGWADKIPLLSIGDIERAEFRNIEYAAVPVGGFFVVFSSAVEDLLKKRLTDRPETRFLVVVKGRPTAIVTGKELWFAVDRLQSHTAVFVPYQCSSMTEVSAIEEFVRNALAHAKQDQK
jgi:hypothetical protein